MAAAPVVDLGLLAGDGSAPPHSALVATVRAALLGESNGAMVLVNHGVPAELIGAMFSHLDGFMAQPLEDKLRCAVDEGSPLWQGSGYYTFGQSEARIDPERAGVDTLGGSGERFTGATVVDDRGAEAGASLTSSAKRRLTEFYMFKFEQRARPYNVWPSDGFRADCEAYIEAVLAMARRLLPVIAVALELPAETFDAGFTDPNAQLRCNHYPPTPDGEEGGMRIGGHTDSSFMTLLPQRADQPKGLELQRADGSWVSPEPIGGSFLVNVGKILKLWSNGAARPTPHRVVDIVADRISLPLFLHPNWDCLLSPITTAAGATDAEPLFPSMSVGEFMRKWHAGELASDAVLSKL